MTREQSSQRINREQRDTLWAMLLGAILGAGISDMAGPIWVMTPALVVMLYLWFTRGDASE